MTQQDDITQRVLTDLELLDVGAKHGRPSVALLPIFRAVESALLSKLRASVADERAAFEQRFHIEPENWSVAGGGGYRNVWYEARWEGWKARAALASAPVAGEAVVDQRENNRHYGRGYYAGMRRLQREVAHIKDEYGRAVLKVVDRLIEAQAERDAAREERDAALRASQQRAGDVVRDALWTLTEHNALHFGEQHSTVIQGRAALSATQTRQGGRDAQD